MPDFRTPSSSSPNPTRQMLDDLDALMERMLSLPVTDMADALGEPLPPSVAVTTMVEDTGVSMPAADPPAPATPNDLAVERAAGLVESPPLPLQGPHVRPVPVGKVIVGRLSAPPLFTAPAQERENVKGLEPDNEQLPAGLWSDAPPAADELLPPPSMPAPIVQVPATTQILPSRRAVTRLPMRLLLAINQGFDRCTTWLGGPGKWLRSSAGRHVLGLVGLGLLALAAAWCLHDWLGWTWPGDSLE